MTVYVYAITSRDHPCRLDGTTGVGARAAPVRVLAAGELRAVVSDIDEEIRPRRRDVAAHQAVQDRLMADGTPLPLQFGYTAPDDASVRHTLEEHAQTYRAALDRVEGCAEYNVKASREQERLLREILDDSPEARRLNDAIVAGSQDPRLPLELGRMVAAEVELRHASAASDLVRALVGPAREHVLHQPVGSEDFLNLSLLVPRDEEAALVKAHAAVARDDDKGVSVRLSGPLPPYSFVP
ncbi:GvpL/GvpF family gas vesicle protein [Streptomyces antimicrobicus]|uniref:GvpL/GvpF family gas vesicle protein n=1 Tax=Streptomyces antimicrobicus TaxID=2883108 RepID=A0ABS8B3L8_9ACTN|nr:GvpL/GvpF family gas vesicle protein [Streptomyces antimicrobicus]MCB5179204.1 GvpL/GvpF family gas vesicle protein [Streptomyces antimicrobicus]